jgi:DNA adenine methylase
MKGPSRPILRYHGGKWLLADWIIDSLPPHRIYVEPFGGAASVLLQKPRAYSEIYNDLSGEIVNLFRVARDRGLELVDKLRLTPFAREEFSGSFEPCDCALEQARRTVVRSFMGFGSNALNRSIRTGFRSNSNRSGTTPAHDWANLPEAYGAIIERLRGVVVENRQARAVIETHDGPETLIYADPPYVASTRMAASATKGYDFEMTDEDHRGLAETLKSCRSMVVISGYPCKLYEELYAGWFAMERASRADGARPRTECLWLNEAAASQRNQRTLDEVTA